MTDISTIHMCDNKILPWKKQLEVIRLRASEDNFVDSLTFTDAINAPIDNTAAAVLLTGKRWRVGQRIKISFLDGSTELKNKVKKYAEYWLNDANLDFLWTNNIGDSDVRITFNRGGSWSYVGTDALVISKQEATMQFGWLTVNTPTDEFRRVVMHEFGHMLGLGHEHSHPKGGIPWNKPRCYEYYRETNGWSEEDVNRQVFQVLSVSQTNFSKYDPKSIMHYSIPAELLTDPSRAVGWNTYRSTRDKNFIETQYPFN